jgi:hypothetical protein
VQWIDENLMKDTRLHGSRFPYFPLAVLTMAPRFCIALVLHCWIVLDGLIIWHWLLECKLDAWMPEGTRE